MLSVNKNLIQFGLIAGLISAACSSDNNKESGKEFGLKRINTNNFVNTADREQLINKAKEAKSHSNAFETFTSPMPSKHSQSENINHGSINSVFLNLTTQKANDSEKSPLSKEDLSSCYLSNFETVIINDKTSYYRTETCLAYEGSENEMTCKVKYRLESAADDVTDKEIAEYSCTDTAESDIDANIESTQSQEADYDNQSNTTMSAEVDFTNIHSCDEAFDLFEKVYNESADALQQIITLASSENQFQLNDGQEVASQEIEADEKSALAFSFSPVPGDQSMEFSGTFSGGANEHILIANFDYKMKMNLSMPTYKEPEKNTRDRYNLDFDTNSTFEPFQGNMETNFRQTIGADLNSKIIELSLESKINHVSGDNASSTSLKNNTVISYGDTKFIEQTYEMNNQGSESPLQQGSLKFISKAVLTSKDRIDFNAEVTSSENNGSVSFSVVRDEQGSCSVTDIKSNLK